MLLLAPRMGWNIVPVEMVLQIGLAQKTLCKALMWLIFCPPGMLYLTNWFLSITSVVIFRPNINNAKFDVLYLPIETLLAKMNKKISQTVSFKIIFRKKSLVVWLFVWSFVIYILLIEKTTWIISSDSRTWCILMQQLWNFLFHFKDTLDFFSILFREAFFKPTHTLNTWILRFDDKSNQTFNTGLVVWHMYSWNLGLTHLVLFGLCC